MQVKTNGRCRNTTGCVWNKNNREKRGNCIPRPGLYGNEDLLRGKKRGSGAEGTVYDACFKGDNRYVVKITRYDPNMIRHSLTAASLGVGPRVVNITRTEWGECAVTYDRLENTLSSVLRDGKLQDLDKKRIATLIDTLLSRGIVHNDLHTENVMYTTNPDGTRRWFLIDYGMSLDVSKIGSISYNAAVDDICTIRGAHGHVTVPVNSYLVSRHTPLVDRSLEEKAAAERIKNAKILARNKVNRRRAKYKRTKHLIQIRSKGSSGTVPNIRAV